MTSHSTDEESKLDQSLASDSILIDSLRKEDKRRKLGQRTATAMVLLVLLAGGWFLLSHGTGVAAAGENLVQEGWKLWQARQLEAAEEKFREATQLAPKSPTAWNGLGWALNNQGKHEEAIEAFETGLAISPNLPAALNGLGQSLLSQRKYEEAEENLLKAAPQAPAAWYGLARVYLLTGKFKEAETWCQKAANSQPQDMMMQQMLDAAKAGELPEALRSQIEPPDVTEVQVMRAWQFLNTGKMVEARDAFESVLKQHPDHDAATNGLAFTLLNLGETKQAKPLFERLVEKSDQALGAMNGLARCLKAEGDTEGAIKLWKALDEKVEGVDAGTAGLAQTYLELGDFEQAKSYFERLVTDQPLNPGFERGLQQAKAGLKQ